MKTPDNLVETLTAAAAEYVDSELSFRNFSYENTKKEREAVQQLRADEAFRDAWKHFGGIKSLEPIVFHGNEFDFPRFPLRIKSLGDLHNQTQTVDWESGNAEIVDRATHWAAGLHELIGSAERGEQESVRMPFFASFGGVNQIQETLRGEKENRRQTLTDNRWGAQHEVGLVADSELGEGVRFGLVYKVYNDIHRPRLEQLSGLEMQSEFDTNVETIVVFEDKIVQGVYLAARQRILDHRFHKGM